MRRMQDAYAYGKELITSGRYCEYFEYKELADSLLNRGMKVVKKGDWHYLEAGEKGSVTSAELALLRIWAAPFHGVLRKVR